MLGFSQIGSLFGDGRYDSCKLFVVDRIIDFPVCKLLRVEGERMQGAIEIGLRQDRTYGKVGGPLAHTGGIERDAGKIARGGDDPLAPVNRGIGKRMGRMDATSSETSHLSRGSREPDKSSNGLLQTEEREYRRSLRGFGDRLSSPGRPTFGRSGTNSGGVRHG